MFTRRGQQSAPFEVLIAVILMGFVLAIGLNVTQQLSENECYQKNNLALNNFKYALEQSSSGTNKTNLDLHSCDNRQVQKLTLKTITNPNQCEAQCAGAQGACVILQLTNPAISKCVHIAPQTNFPDVANNCLEQESFRLVDLKNVDSIPSGVYQFTPANAGSIGDSTPIICAQRQCRGNECNAPVGPAPVGE